MRNLTAISVVASIAIGLFVAGCGGDDSAEIDKATFVKQVNRICEQTSGKMAAGLRSVMKREAASSDSDFDGTQTAIAAEAVVPGLEEELQQIQALGIPEEDQKDAEAFVKAYQQVVDRAKASPEAVSRGAVSYAAIDQIGARMGIVECPVAAVSGI